MAKALQIVLCAICTSFYFFPFYPMAFPAANTKMLMALCGLITLMIKMANEGRGTIDKDMFVITIYSLFVSLASLLAMVVNDSPDTSYLTYFISMWVWVGGAYFITQMIKWTHRHLSIELVFFYLFAVSALQCILAITADLVPDVKDNLDSMMYGEGFMGRNEGRLYGLGCALDVAGGRFAALLVAIAYFLPRIMKRSGSNLYLLGLLCSYIIIAFIGNMIGRTTMVGLVISIVYIVYVLVTGGNMVEQDKRRFSMMLVSTIVCISIIGTLLYNSNNQWRSNIRFGFEGFVSLIEKGKWEIKSNNQLKNQYIWPDNSKTWIIGDGRMSETDIDPYYTGIRYNGFYKYTDVGYCRFIFYFGVIGLFLFSLFYVRVTVVLARRFLEYRALLIWILLVNFIIWLKVSTDIFLIFAPLLCISEEEQQEYSLAVIKD